MPVKTMLTEPQILKLRLYLNKTRNYGYIKTDLDLPIGKINVCSLLQYVIYLMKENSHKYDDYVLVFNILLKQTDIREFDNNGNNVLFYAAILGDYKILRALIDACVPVVKNKEGKKACEYADIDWLDSYCGRFSSTKNSAALNKNKGNEGSKISTNSYASILLEPDSLACFANQNLKNCLKDCSEACNEDLNNSNSAINLKQSEDEQITNQEICADNNRNSDNIDITDDSHNSDLLDMKPNIYETNILENKLKHIMGTDESIKADEEKDRKEEIYDNEIYECTFQSGDNYKYNNDNIIKSLSNTKFISEEELKKVEHETLSRFKEESLKFSQIQKGNKSIDSIVNSENTRDLSTETKNETLNYQSYKNNVYLNEVDSDSNLDYYNYTVARFDFKELANSRYSEIKPREVKIKKFPGSLFVHVDSISNFIYKGNNIESVTVKVICNEFDIEYTNLKKEEKNINFSELISFKVKKAKINLKFFVVIKYSQTSMSKLFSTPEYRKVLKSEYYINDNNIKDFHNQFTKIVHRLEPYKSYNLLNNIKDVFAAELPKADYITTYITYVSKPEIPRIKINTKNLVNFLDYRQNSTILWYSGYVNIRGECKVATFLWKRRLIEWHGYFILIFNDSSYKYVGMFDISGCKYVTMNDNNILEHCIKIVGKEGIIELQVDNEVNFKNIKEAVGNCLNPTIN